MFLWLGQIYFVETYNKNDFIVNPLCYRASFVFALENCTVFIHVCFDDCTSIVQSPTYGNYDFIVNLWLLNICLFFSTGHGILSSHGIYLQFVGSSALAKFCEGTTVAVKYAMPYHERLLHFIHKIGLAACI